MNTKCVGEQRELISNHEGPPKNIYQYKNMK